MMNYPKTAPWRTHPMMWGSYAVIALLGVFDVMGLPFLGVAFAMGWLLGVIASELRAWGIKHSKCT